MTKPKEPMPPADDSRRPRLTLINNSMLFDEDLERAAALSLLAFLKDPLGPESEAQIAALEARRRPRATLAIIKPTSD